MRRALLTPQDFHRRRLWLSAAVVLFLAIILLPDGTAGYARVRLDGADPDATVRAIRFFHEARRQDLIPDLVALLDHPESKVRETAFKSLSALDIPPVVPVMWAAYTDGRISQREFFRGFNRFRNRYLFHELNQIPQLREEPYASQFKNRFEWFNAQIEHWRAAPAIETLIEIHLDLLDRIVPVSKGQP